MIQTQTTTGDLFLQENAFLGFYINTEDITQRKSLNENTYRNGKNPLEAAAPYNHQLHNVGICRDPGLRSALIAAPQQTQTLGLWEEGQR